jgi:hypothetical protein
MAGARVEREKTEALPYALTFFLSPAERREVLRALRRRHTDRARALCLALGVEVDVKSEGGK